MFIEEEYNIFNICAYKALNFNGYDFDPKEINQSLFFEKVKSSHPVIGANLLRTFRHFFQSMTKNIIGNYTWHGELEEADEFIELKDKILHYLDKHIKIIEKRIIH